MKANSLYAKLSASLVVLLFAIGIGYFTLSQSATRDYLKQINHGLNRDLAKNLVADRNLVEDKRLNEAALKSTFMSYMVVNPSIEIYLLDITGKILSFSAEKGVVKRNHVSLGPINLFLSGPTHFPLGDDPRSHVRQKAFSVTPVPSSDNVEGYLYVVLRGEQFDEVEKMAAEQALSGPRAKAMLLSLVVGLIVGLLIFYWLTKRLSGLSSDMAQFQKEVMSVPNTITSSDFNAMDEIDQLASRFNEMRLRITQQIQTLEERDDQRRNLIAQASHDLRTPLASMLGYLESISLKGDALPEAERSKYLAVAIRQGERLNRLVTSLFDLASLEAAHSPPELEPLVVPDLLSDLSRKYQLQADKNCLDIRVEIEPHLPLVSADVGMLERVVDNLISNVFSHSQARSSIILSAQKSKDGKQVIIGVEDDGKGLAESDLAQIFEPFYRLDNSNAGEHGGLGLAIVKQLMGLLGGTVDVKSQLGEGTRFEVRLNVANL